MLHNCEDPGPILSNNVKRQTWRHAIIILDLRRQRQADVWSFLASQHNLVDKPQATARNPKSKIARKIVHRNNTQG